MAGLVGQQLNGGKYTVERELGRGRFGVTYLASDRQGNRWVIKTLSDDLLSKLSQADIDRFQNKFMQEALLLAKCRHPHIVQVEEVFTEGQRVCIAMEYLDGVDLANCARKILPEKEALCYIQQIGEALKIVHKNGLVHRDVKPANMMLRAGKPEAVLIDFGLARGVESPLTTARPVRADGFAPLELYYPDAERGAYTDVYSLAATLYVLLTGQLPPSAIDRSQKKANLIPPKEINPQISDRVNQAILKGMGLAAEDRPKSMQAWLNLLGLQRAIPMPWQNWDLMVWLAVVGTVATVLGTIAAWLALKPASQPSPSPIRTAPPATQSITPNPDLLTKLSGFKD